MNIHRLNILREIISANIVSVNCVAGRVYSSTHKEFTSTNGSGYITARIPFKGKSYGFSVHEIIAVAGGLDMLDMTVNHKDGNKLNNAIFNLEAVTHFSNMQHAHKNGLIPKYKKTKLNYAQVNEIRKLFGDGEANKAEIGRRFNVSESQVCNIINGRCWNDGDVERKPYLGRRKLNMEQVKEIRKLHSTGDYTQAKLSKMYNVSFQQISNIINFIRWKDVV